MNWKNVGGEREEEEEEVPTTSWKARKGRREKDELPRKTIVASGQLSVEFSV